MKRLQLILTALIGLVLIGCSSEDGIQSVVIPQESIAEETEVPILFSSVRSNTTRADHYGADAANLLGNKFVVSGYKGSQTTWNATDNSIVFDNYVVEYQENTAHTTQSNVANWEYVGKTPIKHATNRGITSQKIKYWDYTQPQYDFLGWSTGTKTAIYEGTPGDGQVLVSAIIPVAATSPATGLGAAYTFTGKAADLSQCYISDLVTVNKSGSPGIGEVTGYGSDPVTLRFRQLGTKVRIALYETVPGYSVKDVQFYSAAASNDAQSSNAILFTTTDNDIFTDGTYSVYFPTVDDPGNADNNQAHVSFTGSGTQSTVVSWGGLNYTTKEDGEKTAGSVFLGRSSNQASFAGNVSDNYYVVFLPNQNGTNLNLRVNYTLESTDGSGEVINVKGATAQVPSIYTQWKPGYAYTYIFKISDKTNGHTGYYDPTHPDDITYNSDPAGLYPITFDAIVENAEDNDATQETITTVTTPSITTYQKGSNVVNNDEYTAGNDIFVTVSENNDLATLTDKAVLYQIPSGTTEADVVDALQCRSANQHTGSITGRSGLELITTSSTLTNSIQYGVDGNTITLGTDQAMRFTPASATYAFVYTKTAATAANDIYRYEVVSKSVGASVAGLYKTSYTAAPSGDVVSGTKYFRQVGSTYVPASVFLGQNVSNLYTDISGPTAATGYAVTGTTYYYLNGSTYTAAHNVAYADFATAGLYTLNGTDYVLTSDTTPVNGKAYYYYDGANYIYCVIQPQQTTGLYVVTETACTANETAVAGTTYYVKYTQNDGVYYTKVIKVQ